MRRASFLAFLVACSCATARVSTADERAVASAILTNVETAVTALFATEKISADDLQLALQQVAELRALVASSETTPVSWPDLLQRVTNVALQWAVQPDDQ